MVMSKTRSLALSINCPVKLREWPCGSDESGLIMAPYCTGSRIYTIHGTPLNLKFPYKNGNSISKLAELLKHSKYLITVHFLAPF